MINVKYCYDRAVSVIGPFFRDRWPCQYWMFGAMCLIDDAVTVQNRICLYPLSHASRWAIGGRWLQSPASQDGDGGKPAFKEGHFDNVIGRGSLRFLACEKVLDIANLSYNNDQSPRARTASRSTRIFRREAGDSMAPHWKMQVTEGWEAGDSNFDRLYLHDLVLRCHTKYEPMLMC